MEYNVKYPIKIGIYNIDFINTETQSKFKNDFDNVYNVFCMELGDLMEKYGVKTVHSFLSEHTPVQEWLFKRHF